MKNLIIYIGLGKMHPINTSLVFFFKLVIGSCVARFYKKAYKINV